jgi:hypothetical protein
MRSKAAQTFLTSRFHKVYRPTILSFTDVFGNPAAPSGFFRAVLDGKAIFGISEYGLIPQRQRIEDDRSGNNIIGNFKLARSKNLRITPQKDLKNLFLVLNSLSEAVLMLQTHGTSASFTNVIRGCPDLAARMDLGLGTAQCFYTSRR